jgi:hypothetical protein
MRKYDKKKRVRISKKASLKIVLKGFFLGEFSFSQNGKPFAKRQFRTYPPNTLCRLLATNSIGYKACHPQFYRGPQSG